MEQEGVLGNYANETGQIVVSDVFDVDAVYSHRASIDIVEP